MDRRSLVWAGMLGMGITACTADSSRGTNDKTQTSHAALAVATAQHLAWGDAPGQLGFRPGMRESLALGAPAVGIAPNGAVLVLDALHQRVVKAQKGDVSELAKVPVDCDDLAVAADGAFAVRRSVTNQVLVFSPAGERIGTVDTSAVPDADAIALGSSRRVFVTNGFQQTFLVGSPSMPQAKAAVQANVREGAALLPDGSGVVAVKNGDEVELCVIAQTSQGDERAQVKSRFSFGKSSAARIVGAGNGVACARIEHVATDGAGAVAVKREAACLELATGKMVFRRELPSPGAYVPRRELAFDGATLVFARATGDGLDVQAWAIEGGVR